MGKAFQNKIIDDRSSEGSMMRKGSDSEIQRKDDSDEDKIER